MQVAKDLKRDSELMPEEKMSKHEGNIIATHDGLSVIACNECGYRHLDPLPDESEEDFFEDVKPEMIANQTKDLEWLRLVHADRYEMLEAHLGDLPKTILDVGCGAGWFLETGQQRGWECRGAEASAVAAKHARSIGVEVIRSHFDSNLSLACFGVVSMINVLEHIRNPRAMIRRARAALADNGLLLVVVPNDFNRFQIAAYRAFLIPKWWINASHINYFNHDSLISLLTNDGFDLISRTSSFPMEMFLLMGNNDYVTRPEIGKECHRQRRAFDVNVGEDIRREWQKAIANLDLGREAVVVARKR